MQTVGLFVSSAKETRIAMESATEWNEELGLSLSYCALSAWSWVNVYRWLVNML